MGLLMTWFLLAPAAQAAVPPSPTVTTPATSDLTVLVADQPIHFEGTVAGPVSNFDQIHVDNVLPPPAARRPAGTLQLCPRRDDKLVVRFRRDLSRR